jgi:hypothetical protein
MAYSGQVRVIEAGGTWTQLAQVTGPGVLRGVGVSGSDHRDHYIEIKCDGGKVAKGLVAGSMQGEYENAGLTFDIPFDNDLEVLARDDPPNPHNNVYHNYWISITTGYPPVDDVDS